MKTKLIALALIIAAMFMFAGCTSDRIAEDTPSLNNRFERLYTDTGWNDGIGGVVYYRDMVTDALYFNMGHGLSPLLNADGTPVLWSDIESEMEAVK